LDYASIYTKIPAEMVEYLDSTADREGKSKAEVIRELIEKGIETDDLMRQLEKLRGDLRASEGGRKQIEAVKANVGNPVDYDAIGAAVARQLEPIKSQIDGLRTPSEPKQVSTMKIVPDHLKACEECYRKLVDMWKDAKFQCSKCNFPYFWDRSVLDSDEFVCPMCGFDGYEDRKA